jgi:hypothetical protein
MDHARRWPRMLDASLPEKARRRARRDMILTVVAALVVGAGLARMVLDDRVVDVSLPEPPMPAALR